MIDTFVNNYESNPTHYLRGISEHAVTMYKAICKNNGVVCNIDFDEEMFYINEQMKENGLSVREYTGKTGRTPLRKTIGVRMNYEINTKNYYLISPATFANLYYTEALNDIDMPAKYKHAVFDYDLKNKLKDNDITFIVDDSDKTPGFKFAEAEIKGYPVRIELGQRDLKDGFITIVRRDTLEKVQVKPDEIITKLNELFIDIQNNLYNMAKQRRDSMIKEANTYEEFLNKSKEPGFIKVNWCGNTSCEDKIKDDFASWMELNHHKLKILS